MDLTNPFAAFLAARPPPDRGQKASLSHPVRAISIGPPTPVNGPHDGPAYGGPAAELDPTRDAFATFLTRRPLHASQEVEQLRADVLRAKRQLLEVALQAELRAASGTLPEQDVERIRRLRTAQRYLDHPERLREAITGTDPTPSEDDDRPASVPEADVAAALSEADGYATQLPSGWPAVQEAGARQARGGRPPPLLTASMSAPDLRASAAAGSASASARSRDELPPGTGGSAVLRIAAAAALLAPGAEVTLAVASGAGGGAGVGVPKQEQEPLLSGWYSKKRCFGVMISRDGLQCRRQTMSLTGGCIVLGNGRVPLYSGSHLLCTGYYFAFKVHAVDELQAPEPGGRGLSLAFGVSLLPPRHDRLQGPRCPLFAYEAPGAVLVGYGSQFVDEGKWHKAPWDSRSLQLGDKVGLLVTQDGEFVVFVNDAQVLRVTCSLCAGASKLNRRSYFPIVDLVGHVAGVTLTPHVDPPNVPLRMKDHLERKLA